MSDRLRIIARAHAARAKFKERMAKDSAPGRMPRGKEPRIDVRTRLEPWMVLRILDEWGFDSIAQFVEVASGLPDPPKRPRAYTGRTFAR